MRDGILQEPVLTSLAPKVPEQRRPDGGGEIPGVVRLTWCKFSNAPSRSCRLPLEAGDRLPGIQPRYADLNLIPIPILFKRRSRCDSDAYCFRLRFEEEERDPTEVSRLIVVHAAALRMSRISRPATEKFGDWDHRAS